MVSRLSAFASKVKGLFSKQKADSEFNDEMQAHLQLLTERFVRHGLTPSESAVAARRQFGNVTLLQEDRREIRTVVSIETLWRDLRYGLRTLWKSRGFATVAIITLALGIGASTAIFSVIDNVLMEPFPYEDAGRMMFPQIHDMAGSEEVARANYTSPELLAYAEQNHVFDRVIGTAGEEVLYKEGEGAERFYGAHITPGTFEFFGMPAFFGRVMQPADYEPGAPPVFVLRYKTWVSRFNRDPQALNKIFILSGIPRTLIGIMPPRFGWFDSDVYIPEKPEPAAGGAGFPIRWFLVGHLKPGVAVRQAEADLTIIANRLAKLHPHDYPTHFEMEVKHVGDGVIGNLRPTLYTALAAVALLLLIGCANVANLMLARATAREKEFALRAVLGAGRSRLVQQLLVESLILALAGTALGTLLAWGGLKFIVAALPQDMIPTEAVIELNAPVLGFTLGVAVLTALIFGLVPALQAARRDLVDPLRDSAKGVSSGFRGGRFRGAVVVVEVAMSLTLLIGAGLLMRSFVALRAEHLGFHPDHVLMALLPLPQVRYQTADQMVGFFRPLLTRLRALPGVVDAAEASAEPAYDGGMQSDIDIPGKAHEEKWSALLQLCSEGYFSVLRMEFKDGRAFSEAEVNGARKLAVVNQTFVRKYLGNGNPMGARVHVVQLESSPDPVQDAWFEIIGVVADARNQGLQLPIQPEMWIPYTVTNSVARIILVRTAQEPLAMMNSVRREIWASDSGVAVAYPGTLEGFISSRSYAGPRFGFMVTTIFGCIGLVLVTIGVYSVLAYTAARRTQEIGIRMALGAERAEVLGMVIKAGLRLVVLGIAIGLIVSLALGRVLATQLWGVSAYDPLTLAGMAALLMAICVVACWIPARRAARVDPLVALRYE
jgi:putative ABC transport system permease protein